MAVVNTHSCRLARQLQQCICNMSVQNCGRLITLNVRSGSAHRYTGEQVDGHLIRLERLLTVLCCFFSFLLSGRKKILSKNASCNHSFKMWPQQTYIHSLRKPMKKTAITCCQSIYRHSTLQAHRRSWGWSFVNTFGKDSIVKPT